MSIAQCAPLDPGGAEVWAPGPWPTDQGALTAGSAGHCRTAYKHPFSAFTEVGASRGKTALFWFFLSECSLLSDRLTKVMVMTLHPPTSKKGMVI